MDNSNNVDAPSLRGGGASTCLDCGATPVSGRRLCKSCRAARELVARQRRIEANKDKPCSVDGCDAPRVVNASQVVPYCREHKNVKAAETRERTRPRERFEDRVCAKCGADFQWRSTHPNQRFCSKDCYTQGILDERKAFRVQRGLERDGLLWCTGCKSHRPVEEFAPSQAVRKSGRCRSCQRETQRKSDEKNPERRRATSRRSSRARRFRDTYGITPEFFDRLVADQDGCCKICGEKADLVADHCHNGGGFRGAICGPCNVGLGAFRDNPKFLEAAASYLL